MQESICYLTLIPFFSKVFGVHNRRLYDINTGEQNVDGNIQIQTFVHKEVNDKGIQLFIHFVIIHTNTVDCEAKSRTEPAAEDYTIISDSEVR